MKSTMRIGTHPIHPMLITFPFALWMTSVLSDLYCAVTDKLHYIGYYLALIGCGFALLAAIPGLIDLLTIVPAGTKARSDGWKHGILNVVALLLFAASVWLRPDPATMNYAAYVTAGLGAILVSISGWLGGTLVYDHKVGVPGVELDAGMPDARR